MTALSAFLRKTPGEALREYFDRPEIGLPTEFDWPASDVDLSGPLLGAIEKMSRVQRDRIPNDAERVHGLSDEPGQAAIYSVAEDPAFLDGACEPGDDNCDLPPGAALGEPDETPGGIKLDIASLPPVYEVPSFDDSEVEAEEVQQLEDHLGAVNQEQEASSDLSEELFTSNLGRLPGALEDASGEGETATALQAGTEEPQEAQTAPVEQEPQETAGAPSDAPESAQEPVEAAPGNEVAQGQAMDPELTERFMKSIERAIMDSDDPEALIARLGRINGVLARGEMVTPQMLEGMPDYLVREFEVGGALDASAEAAAVPVRLDRSEIPRNNRGIPTVTEENMWIYHPDGIMLPMPGGGTLEDVEDIQSFGLDP